MNAVLSALPSETRVEHPAQKARVRLDFLDALRGLAAAYVLLYHMILLPSPNLVVPRWLAAFAGNGGSGVTLFFVVSTFSLFYTMPARLREPTPRFSFYLHRVFRIAPLFYALILLTMLRDRLLFGVTHSLSEIAGMATFVYNLIPGRQESFVWAGWTIGVEMLFYAAFPFIYARVRNIHGAVVFFLVSLLSWHIFLAFLQYLPLGETEKSSIAQWFVLRHLPIFALGGVAFFALRGHLRNESPGASQSHVGVLLVTVAVFVYYALLNGWLPNLFGAGYYWQGVVYALAVCGLCLWPWRLLVNRLTIYLGKISYSVYLLHPTIVYAMGPLYNRIYEVVPTASLALLICFTLTLFVVAVASTLTYRLIEEPFVRRGRRLYARMKEKRGAA
jgi:peptidoglycan/LPS O-acetylase OafA/YrhL